MRSVYRYASNGQDASPRRRAVALLLALVLHALLVLLLLRLAPSPPPPREPERNPLSFSLAPDAQETAKGERAETEAKRAAEAEAPPKPTPPAEPMEAPKPPPPPNFLVLSREDFAASDIGKVRSAPPPGRAGDSNAGDSASAYGPGEGPGGARLYKAEWYREPTDAELGFYMPANAPRTGWGAIACQTVEKYHVDNCRELDESPRGSGLSRAVRQAAWQFLVRPPRIGGRPMIGAWVRIHIEYKEGVAKK